MGFLLVTHFLVLFLFFNCSVSQRPNTDSFYISDFLVKMGFSVASSLSPSSEVISSVCSMNGVVCDSEKEKVFSFSASGLGLSGEMPENTIGKLSELQSLDLSGNNISSLSSDFWGLGSSLKSLNLSSNDIAGYLPNNIGNFGKLESLDLSCNRLSGEIPTGLGSAFSLKHLNLSGNFFEGRIQDSLLVGLKSLVSVDLSRNKLNGSVPESFSNELEALDLSGNQFHGRMPNISNLVKINYLNLSNNLFQGSVLGVFQQSLKVIDLSNNQLDGHFSQVNLNTSFTWFSSLVYLDLSGNQLSGDFISDWNGFLSLKHLNLACNRFSHQKFPMIDKLSGLEYVNLSKTGIEGRIPDELSQLGKIRVLDLSRNRLTGSVPDLNVASVVVLDLSVNNLSGEIPPALQAKLLTMERFNFSYNNITFCASNFSPRLLKTAFIGSQNDCPIAANPELIKRNQSKHRGLKLALVIALAAFFVMLAFICIAFGLRKRTRAWAVKQLSYKEDQNISGPFSFQTDSTKWVADVKSANSVPVVVFEKPLVNLTFTDLLSATSNFDRGTLLAEGRFGPVYRGFLPGGFHVAVKVLVHGSTLTEHEAAKELERLGQIKHPNLVPLVGYCLAGDQRIAIYEYMENGNLQNLLHDLPLGVQMTEDWSNDTWDDGQDGVQSITTEGLTTWRFRHKIALGTARALAFLHHGCFPQIVHRDVKASSVYLDSTLEPRLSDFGLGKVVCNELEDEISRGSPGYTPPEFNETETCQATSKSDVYCFGVILFELVTGKKPLGDEYPDEKETSLVGWARALVRKNQGMKAIDPKIRETGLEKQMEEALRIAYLCTADLLSKRPTMQQIVGLLKDIEPVLVQDQ